MLFKKKRRQLLAEEAVTVPTGLDTVRKTSEGTELHKS